MTVSTLQKLWALGTLSLMTAISSATAAESAPAAASRTIAIAALARTNAVEFEREILPSLRTSCLACHNRTKAKAGLILETPMDILKGGESGPAVVPRKSAESLLLKVSAHQEKPYMPPKDNKVEAADLTPEQLALLKLWIDQGATGEVRGSAVVEWQPLPEGVNPILAVALSEDAQMVACGRANQLSLYHLPTQRLIERLTDPALGTSGLYPKTGAAHRDMVNSVAFSRDGNWLASGDYQAVKLWHRKTEETRTELRAPFLKPATALTASPDGQWLVTGHTDGSLALWKGSEGTLRTQWMAHAHPIQKISFSPDADRVLSTSGSHRAGIWSFSEARNIAWIPTPGSVTAVVWHPNGRQIVTAGDDLILRLWALPGPTDTNATLIREFKGHTNAVTSLAMTAKAPGILASGSLDGSLLFWDVEKGGAPRRAEHGAPVIALALRDDGGLVASAGSNGVARIWQVSDLKSLHELKGDRLANDAVGKVERSIALSKAEITYREAGVEEVKKRAKTEADYALKILETRLTAERTLSEKLKASLAAMEGRASAEKAPADLAAELIKVNADREAAEAPARLAETEAANALKRVERAKATAEASRKAAAELAEAAKAEAGKSAPIAQAKATAEKLAADAAQFLEDAKAVADRFAKDAEPRRKTAEEAKVTAQKRTAEIAEKQKQAPEKLATALKTQIAAEKETDTALAAKRSAEDQLVSAQRAAKRAADAIPEAEGALQMARDSLKKTEEALIAAKQTAADAVKPILALSFSHDGTRLLTTSSGGRLQTWSPETGLGIQTLAPAPGPITALALAGPGSTLILSSNGIPLRITQTESWSLARMLGSYDQPSPIKGRVNALQFNAEGTLLAVGSGDPSRSGELNLWDVGTGKLTRSFTNAHSDVVLAVDFSPDSKSLASSGADRFVKVWELSSGKMSRSFEGHTHHVLGVSWRPDGRTLASAGADKLIKLWNIVTGEQKRTIGGAEKEVTSICYVEATNEALVTSGDSQVRLVNDEGKTVRSFGTGSDFVQSAAVTPDGKWVIGGGQDSILRLWNGQSGQLVKSFNP